MTTNTSLALIVHTVIVLALIGAYVALTMTGHNADTVLGVAGGYLGGAASTTVTGKATTPAP